MVGVTYGRPASKAGRLIQRIDPTRFGRPCRAHPSNVTFPPLCIPFARQVSIEEGDTRAKELGILFIETSAKAGFNIKVNRARYFSPRHAGAMPAPCPRQGRGPPCASQR